MLMAGQNHQIIYCMNGGEDFIKKARVQYMCCRKGQQHQGQKLTLVCVDSSCSRRGLICPVCRSIEHEGHKTLPLKIFLQEASNRFSSASNDSQLNSLSDYLRQLDVTKKELLKELRRLTTKLSSTIQDLQAKIEQNYVTLRKMTLAEATISTKLPRLIKMMLEVGAQQDQQYLYDEFQKYAMLATYEQDVVKFQDNVKKVLEQYSESPSLVQEAIDKALAEISTQITQIPFIQQANSKATKENTKYTFNEANKHQKITLISSKNLSFPVNDAESSENTDDFLLAMVAEPPTSKNQVINVKCNGFSGGMTIGFGIVEIIKKGNFKMLGDMNHGVYGLSASGYPIYHGKNDDEECETTFEITNEVVQIETDTKNRKITFTKKSNNQKYVMTIKEANVDMSKMQFVFGLLAGDSIQIVD